MENVILHSSEMKPTDQTIKQINIPVKLHRMLKAQAVAEGKSFNLHRRDAGCCTRHEPDR